MTADGLMADCMWLVNIRGEYSRWEFSTSPADVPVLQQVVAWVRDLPTLGLCLYGDVGVGKTGLMVSAVRAYVQAYEFEAMHKNAERWNGILIGTGIHKRRMRNRPLSTGPVWFESWTDIDNLVKIFINRPRGDDEIDDPMEKLLGVELLAIDDLDVGPGSEFKESLVLRLLNQMMVGQKTIITLNQAPVKLIGQLGRRVVDRLSDGSKWTRIKVPGSSKRSKI